MTLGGKNERQDAIKPECFLGAGEIFIGGNIYGHFRRHLLTLNKSLELELDTDAKRIKSKKIKESTVLGAPSPPSHTQLGSSVFVSADACFPIPWLDMFSIDGQLNLQPVLNHLWSWGT